MRTYFNEFDAYPARWLANLWPDAVIDDRSIADVQPDDVTGIRAHFFAGIGGWEYALDLAGWPADRPVWTGSCPCQPFSAAGRGLGAADPRHLWPEFYRLIAERRPATIFGEQVGGAAGRAWLSAVRADLEALGYAVGAADLCAAGVGAPHIRQRLYWVAQSTGTGRSAQPKRDDRADGWAPAEPGRLRDPGGMADADGRQPGDGDIQRGRKLRLQPPRGGASVGLGNADVSGRETRDGLTGRDSARLERTPLPSAWDDAEWLPCADGKSRPTGPRIRPLAHGVPARASKLRAYGNAIVPQLAAVFVVAFMETEMEIVA